METDILLWVPARTSSIRLLRTVAASAGARSNLGVDDIDDIRLAVTEAASQLLGGVRGASTLCLRLSQQDRALRVRITIEAGSGDGGRIADDDRRAAVERSLAWQVLLALGEDVRFVADGTDVGITFAKTRHAAARP